MQSINLKLKISPNTLSKNAAHQVGFSLVELMVGLVIGLLATLAIMQVFGVFEGQKRTTSGNADAQTNGSVALYNMQRDVRLGGYGLPLMDDANLGLKCNATTVATKAMPPNSLSIPINLVPVVIQDGGNAAGASDSITANYGVTANAGLPVEVSALELQEGAVFPVNIINNMNCQNRDIVIAIDGSNCAAQQITSGAPFPNAISLTALPRAAGKTSTHITLYSNEGITAGSKISCVTGWNSVTYSVVNNQLMRGAEVLIDGIVNMQAQYGISATPHSNQITQWVNATGIWATTAATPTMDNRNRIKAVRVAIVARIGLLEKPPAVSTACSSITAANPTGVCAWDATSANPSIASPAPTINLTNTPSWGQYRYRVYESIIPLRNVVWTRDRL